MRSATVTARPRAKRAGPAGPRYIHGPPWSSMLVTLCQVVGRLGATEAHIGLILRGCSAHGRAALRAWLGVTAITRHAQSSNLPCLDGRYSQIGLAWLQKWIEAAYVHQFMGPACSRRHLWECLGHWYREKVTHKAKACDNVIHSIYSILHSLTI